MAKRKKNKAALPKRVAGLKIPKAVRKGGWPALLASPIGAGVVSNLITAAAAGMAGHEAQRGSRTRRAAAHATGGVEHAVGNAGAAMNHQAQAFTYALGEAARTFADTFRAGRTPETAQAAPVVAPAAEPEKRRSGAYPQSDTPAH